MAAGETITYGTNGNSLVYGHHINHEQCYLEIQRTIVLCTCVYELRNTVGQNLHENQPHDKYRRVNLPFSCHGAFGCC